ncbi:Xaa-Pro aminopeptidase [Bradyrhizobium sp. LB1.3]
MRCGVPFSTARLDRLLDDAGIDVLIVTSKHNIQYLLGGYYHFQFDYMEAIGISRYLPIFVYVKGALEKSAYIANRNERDSVQNRTSDGYWMPAIVFGSSTTVEAMALAVKQLKSVAPSALRVGIEGSFLPADAADVLRREFGHCQFVEAMRPLEKLRAVKTAAELDVLREASERVVASMMTTVNQTRPGQSKREIIDHLRQAELSRDMIFEYALVTLGTSLNRAPSEQRLEPGDVVSLGFGRQLPRLHRRPLPDGRTRDSRRRASRSTRRDRPDPAGSPNADPRRPLRQRHLHRGQRSARAVRLQQANAFRRPWNGDRQPRSAASDVERPYPLSRRRRQRTA